jgi:hypothetical protein
MNFIKLLTGLRILSSNGEGLFSEENRRAFAHFWENTWIGFLLLGSSVLLCWYKKELIDLINSRYGTSYSSDLLIPVAIFLALVGFLVLIGGFMKPHSGPSENRISANTLVSNSCDLLKEYELSQSMHNYYGKIVWEIASIFIGGGLAGVGIIASRVERPTVIVSLFAIAFTVLMVGFYFMVRRWRDLAEVHLSRCREIEIELGLLQHQYASRANDPSGVIVNGKWLRASFPSGWGTLRGLIIGLVVAVWIIAAYFL